LNGYQLKKRCFAPTFVSTAQRFSSSNGNQLLLSYSIPIPLPKLTKRDGFHNLISVIDKMVIFGIVNLTQQTKLSLSEGGK
jgi:hypothetical protein